MKPIYIAIPIFVSLGILNASASSFTPETWSGTTSSTNPGDWDTSTNWSTSVEPSGTSYEAIFTTGTGLDTSVNVSSNTTVGFIDFSATAPSYTIGTSSTATLTLDGGASGAAQINSGSNTQTFSGNVVIQNSGASTSLALNLSTGTVVFSNTSTLTLKTGVGENSAGGGFAIEGVFNFGNSSTSNLNFNFSKPGTSTLTADLIFAPTSATYTGTTTLTDSAQYSKIDILTNTTSGLSALNVGSGNATAGAIYIGATGIGIATPVSMGPTNSSGTITGVAPYTFGMDSTTAATGTLTGGVTLYNKANDTGTYNFDVAANNTLAISGVIADSAVTSSAGFTVTKTSTGTLVLSSSTGNSYTNLTQVNAGTLLAANGTSGSATGSGTLTVGASGTIGGYSSGSSSSTVGTFLTSGYTVSGNVIAGNGTDATSTVALLAAGATGSFTSANLAFNLDSTSTNASQLQVSANGVSNSINFANTTLTLNVLNSATIAPNTAYNLIYDPNGFNSSTDGLTITNGVITGGLSIGNSTYFGASSGGYATGYYAGSYLFESANGNYIDVEVVPEPSTMALLLGGGICLLLVVRRRSRGNDSR